METAALGRTGITVSRICVGGWQATDFGTSDPDTFTRIVHRALDLGVNFFDTAAAYGNGAAEELLGRALKERRRQAVIATKFIHLKPREVRVSLEESLRRLGTDYVDLYQQHWPPRKPPLAETLGELERLKDEGKIRAIGVSNWMEPEWAEIDRPARVDSLQPCYSLLWRSVEPSVLPLCREHGIAVIPYSPLCQGILAGRFRSRADIPKAKGDPRQHNVRLAAETWPAVYDVLRAVEHIAADYGRTPAQVALRWLLDRPGVTAPIVGATSLAQLDENLGALGWQLEQEHRSTLDEVSRPLSEHLQPHDTLWRWHPRK